MKAELPELLLARMQILRIVRLQSAYRIKEEKVIRCLPR
jgi:hypothetical protein